MMIFRRKNKLESDYDEMRRKMVKRQLIPRGIEDKVVLASMGTVPRHLFVDESLREFAYEDGPLEIGSDQTISQPFVVAYMTEMLKLDGSEKVLEIGTGSGYEDRITINRTLRLKNGKSWTIRHTNPCPPDEEVAELGPIDPEKPY